MITFLDNKYTKIYFQLIEKRKKEILLKEDMYCERHHIIPKSLGGGDEKDNLVNLTAREHFMAHLLLTKMVDDELSLVKMNWALHKMCFSGKMYIGSRDYEWYRKRHSKFLSEHHHSKRIEGWNNLMSDLVFENWKNNKERRAKTSQHFKDLWKDEDYRKARTETNKINAKKGAYAAKLAKSNRLEYMGKIYLGYKELYDNTGVTKLLYQKYYLKGFDPSDRIGSNGPLPKTYVFKPINDKENQ